MAYTTGLRLLNRARDFGGTPFDAQCHKAVTVYRYGPS